MPASRRTILAALTTTTATLTAGCTSFLGGDVDDLTIFNETTDPQTVDVRATRAGNTIHDETDAIQPETAADDNYHAVSELTDERTCTITLDVHDGSTATHDFTDSSTDSYGLHATIQTTTIEFTKTAV